MSFQVSALTSKDSLRSPEGIHSVSLQKIWNDAAVHPLLMPASARVCVDTLGSGIT